MKKEVFFLFFLTMFIPLVSNIVIADAYSDCTIYGNCASPSTTTTTSSSINYSVALNGSYVPYVGAVSYVDLGVYNLTAGDLIADNSVYTAYLCDNFGIGCIDMRGDPWDLIGTSLIIEDNLTVNHLITSHGLLPAGSLTYEIGSGALRWSKLWVQNISAENIDTFTLHATNNITTDEYFIGDGSFLTGISTFNGSYVPYVGAVSDVDLGAYDLNTSGRISSDNYLDRTGTDTLATYGAGWSVQATDSLIANDYYSEANDHFLQWDSASVWEVNPYFDWQFHNDVDIIGDFTVGSAFNITSGRITEAVGNVSLWTNDAGYLQTETDPVFTAWYNLGNFPVYNVSYNNVVSAYNGNYSSFLKTENATFVGLINNGSYLSTYNISYHGLMNNASYLSTFNSTYHNTTQAWEGNFSTLLKTNGTQNFSTTNSIQAGSVGIGAMPVTKSLTVNSSNQFSDPINYAFMTSNTAGGLTAVFMATVASAADTGAGMVGYEDDGATMASGHRLGYLAFGGAKDNIHTLARPTIIESYAAELWNSTATGSDLRFLTTKNQGTTRTTRWTITNNGNLVSGTDGTSSYNITTDGTITARVYVDLTPAWNGTSEEALGEVVKVESMTNNGKTEINHSSIPSFAKSEISYDVCTNYVIDVNAKGEGSPESCTNWTTISEDGRDIGAMITMLTESVKALEKRTLSHELCLSKLCVGIK